MFKQWLTETKQMSIDIILSTFILSMPFSISTSIWISSIKSKEFTHWLQNKKNYMLCSIWCMEKAKGFKMLIYLWHVSHFVEHLFKYSWHGNHRISSSTMWRLSWLLKVIKISRRVYSHYSKGCNNYNVLHISPTAWF